MKEYKLESFIVKRPIFSESNHLFYESNRAIKEKLKEYANNNWQLVSTSKAMDLEYGKLYVYLYFEREKVNA